MRRSAIAVALLAAALGAAPVASAEPTVPQSGTPCSVDLTDVMTWPPDAKMPLVCVGGQWQQVTDPRPPNDRWLSIGPPMILRGEGQRNPGVASGNWTATPQDAGSQCRAEQQTVLSPGAVSAPQRSEGKPGQALSLRLLPRLFTIELSGNCLWTHSPT